MDRRRTAPRLVRRRPPVYKGIFRETQSFFQNTLDYLSKKSKLAATVTKAMQQNAEEEWALFLGLVDTIRSELEDTYPGISFEIVFWDIDDEAGSERFRAAMIDRNVPVHSLTEALATQNQSREGLEIPIDFHPTARANRILARLLRDRLLEGEATNAERNESLEVRNRP